MSGVARVGQGWWAGKEGAGQSANNGGQEGKWEEGMKCIADLNCLPVHCMAFVMNAV